MSITQPQVEYIATTLIGGKGQITIPKQYRDELGLDAGASFAVLRVGEGLMLIPRQNSFRILCESIASVLERRQLTPTDLLDSLPEVRQRLFARRYPELAGQERGETPRLERVDCLHSEEVEDNLFDQVGRA